MTTVKRLGPMRAFPADYPADDMTDLIDQLKKVGSGDVDWAKLASDAFLVFGWLLGLVLGNHARHQKAAEHAQSATPAQDVGGEDAVADKLQKAHEKFLNHFHPDWQEKQQQSDQAKEGEPAKASPVAPEKPAPSKGKVDAKGLSRPAMEAMQKKRTATEGGQVAPPASEEEGQPTPTPSRPAPDRTAMVSLAMETLPMLTWVNDMVVQNAFKDDPAKSRRQDQSQPTQPEQSEAESQPDSKEEDK